MNKDWSENNKIMQMQLKKKETYAMGVETLRLLREDLMCQILGFRGELSDRDFSVMPYKNGDGYHNKTIAYSLWHIFRIEDIVVQTLITGGEQVFFRNNFRERISSPIITTGNELRGDEICKFSEQLCVEELYNYICEVDRATTQMLSSLSYSDLRTKVPTERKRALQELGVVSHDEAANWLIDYWCGKDIKGLIQMPLSRHWIMHIEASLKMKNKILQRQ